MDRKVTRVWHEPIKIDGNEIVNHLRVEGNCTSLHEHIPNADCPLHYVVAKFKGRKQIRVYRILSIEYADTAEDFNTTSRELKTQGPKC